SSGNWFEVQERSGAGSRPGRSRLTTQPNDARLLAQHVGLRDPQFLVARPAVLGREKESDLKFNLMSLGDLITDPVTGSRPTALQRHRAFVDMAVRAEEAGFDGVSMGEHHGIEYIYSAPPVVLAAVAERTTRLRLGTAVTLLANLDALRVAEDYATLDILSGGRVDIVGGRGNFFA